MSVALELEASEKEAAELEGMVPISKEALALQRRYHKLAARMEPLKLEQEAIKELLIEEMRAKGATTLTYKGVPVVAMDPTTTTKVDWVGMFKAFPGAQAYVQKTKKRFGRFNAKKAI